ncbi:MAG TPA: CBS domain-containing protein [Chthoniobacterales bacterium]|nr:CBS domain-containing protein [Chthoniobacterales bacterium]
MRPNSLWTSPQGYRRKGTNLRDLRKLFEEKITAQAVFEPIQACSEQADVSDVLKVLNEKDFDYAGVAIQPEGPVTRFVSRELMQAGKVKDYAQEIPAEFTITEMTPLVKVLSIFKEKDHVFVSAETGVIGIITAADLSKPAVRIYLFGLISLLEMHLGYWIRIKYPDQTCRKQLKEVRISAAEKVLNERRRRDQEIDLLDCLQFCDKRDLVLGHQDLRTALDLDKNADPRRFLVLLERLRNQLAHSQEDLVANSSWQDLIPVIEWAEAVVFISDKLVGMR